MSQWALLGLVFIIANTLRAQENEESFEIEPPVLRQNLMDDSVLAKSAAPAPVLDVAKLEKDLERARKGAAGAERLYKIGALAKVEAEARTLRVVRLESDLEAARLALAKEQALSQKNPEEANETADADAKKVDVDLARAIEAAHAAAAKREQVELEAAEINVRRQQKLLALGSARKSDVARAEQKLAQLKQSSQ